MKTHRSFMDEAVAALCWVNQQDFGKRNQCCGHEPLMMMDITVQPNQFVVMCNHGCGRIVRNVNPYEAVKEWNQGG